MADGGRRGGRWFPTPGTPRPVSSSLAGRSPGLRISRRLSIESGPHRPPCLPGAWPVAWGDLSGHGRGGGCVCEIFLRKSCAAFPFHPERTPSTNSTVVRGRRYRVKRERGSDFTVHPLFRSYMDAPWHRKVLSCTSTGSCVSKQSKNAIGSARQHCHQNARQAHGFSALKNMRSSGC